MILCYNNKIKVFFRRDFPPYSLGRHATPCRSAVRESIVPPFSATVMLTVKSFAQGTRGTAAVSPCAASQMAFCRRRPAMQESRPRNSKPNSTARCPGRIQVHLNRNNSPSTVPRFPAPMRTLRSFGGNHGHQSHRNQETAIGISPFACQAWENAVQ